jgi:hypothetical protein
MRLPLAYIPLKHECVIAEAPTNVTAGTAAQHTRQLGSHEGAHIQFGSVAK